MKWAARLFRRSVRQAFPVARPRALRVESLETREVPASIAGNVFRDFNNSGVSNAPDAPIAGVTVRVTGGALATPVTATSDATGNFTVPGLAAGTYTLTAVAPAGTAAGKSTAGTAAGTAGTTNTVTGITLTADQAATGYTFGEVPTALSSGGKVFFDANGNGTQEAAETGLPGVTVTLTGTSALTGAAVTPKTATTGADGTYLFTGLTSGTYNVAETPKTGFVRGALKNGTPAAASTTGGTFTGIDLTASAAASTGYAFADVKAPVLTLTQSVDTPRALPGQPVTITYTAKNPGTQAINNVAASVNLDGLTYGSTTGTGFDATTKTWTVGTLAPGATATMTVTATAPSAAVFLPASRLVSTGRGGRRRRGHGLQPGERRRAARLPAELPDHDLPHPGRGERRDGLLPGRPHRLDADHADGPDRQLLQRRRHDGPDRQFHGGNYGDHQGHDLGRHGGDDCRDRGDDHFGRRRGVQFPGRPRRRGHEHVHREGGDRHEYEPDGGDRHPHHHGHDRPDHAGAVPVQLDGHHRPRQRRQHGDDGHHQGHDLARHGGHPRPDRRHDHVRRHRGLYVLGRPLDHWGQHVHGQGRHGHEHQSGRRHHHPLGGHYADDAHPVVVQLDRYDGPGERGDHGDDGDRQGDHVRQHGGHHR